MATARALLGVLAALLPCTARAQVPSVGDVQHLQVVSVSLQVGSYDKDCKQVTYAPPPGWYVRSHQVECTGKYGNVSFSVSTVPQNWAWSSESAVQDAYRMLLDLAAKAPEAGLRAKFEQERDRLLAELRKVRSSHHALVVEATARGAGLLRGGAGLQLTVTAELVYVGTHESLSRDIARHRARLEK